MLAYKASTPPLWVFSLLAKGELYQFYIVGLGDYGLQHTYIVG